MKLYNKIEQAIRQHEGLLHVGNNVTEEDIRHAIRWVMRDNPDIFWFVHQYHFDKYNGVVSLRYRCSPKRCAIIQESINDVVDKDFQIKFVRTLSQLEQVAYVYKWMLVYCNYNTNSAYNQNIDSVFVRRNSVCTGYAKAAQYLFRLLGIESRLVFGRLNNDKEEGRHCWNIVCIDGRYYHLDVCLGDLILEDVLKKAGITSTCRYGNHNYNCFCISTDEILKTRSIEDIETLPSCNSMFPMGEIEKLSHIDVKERNGDIGCKLTHIGSSADIFLCTRDKNVVLKKFRGNNTEKCEEEYGYMDSLKGCMHLLQLNRTYSDVRNNILAVEQSTPIVDLFCSHYYHPTINGVLKMIRDITLGWMECYQRGIVYRDIHVCNIFKANDGRYKLGDFGSCTYERRGLRERVGNPWFMSPETYISGQYDERSAVYSITAVLYFVLNGLRPPFIDGNNEEEALQRKMNGGSLTEPTLLNSFPRDLAGIIMTELIAKGCAFYPSKRIQTCKELLHIIDILRSAEIIQRIELQFVQQDTETIIANKTAPNVYIPRDIHHRFAYGEEVERMAFSLRWHSYSEEVERSATTEISLIIDTEGGGVTGEEVERMSETEIMEMYELMVKNSGGPMMAPSMINNSESDGMTEGGADYCLPNKPQDVSTKGYQYADEIESHCRTNYSFDSSASYYTYEPAKPQMTQIVLEEFSNFIPIKKQGKLQKVYSSIFAPSEKKRMSPMIIQVYLHLQKETQKVRKLARESQKGAKRRDYIPLDCKLRKGDKVDVHLNIYGETLLMSDKKSVVWQGTFTKCSFDYFVPKDLDVDELSCVAFLAVNGVPVGEMRFITQIVDSPRQLNPEILAHKYSKVFISYSHQDEPKVKFLHEGLEISGIPHFFDRRYLKAGDVFPQVIQDYINSADLFVLCWSDNASKSEYVQKERLQALKRAFPQVQPEKDAKLRIYPMSIEPRAELPSDMKNNYHFGEI